MNNSLNDFINEMGIDLEIIKKLNGNQVYVVKDLWSLKRQDLKRMGVTDCQIKSIIIKMQLYGIDLNKRIYNKN
jgi:hypothetical protein